MSRCSTSLWVTCSVCSARRVVPSPTLYRLSPLSSGACDCLCRAGFGKVLLHQPAHFHRAFKEPLTQRGAPPPASVNGDPATQWAIQKFWGGVSDDAGDARKHPGVMIGRVNEVGSSRGRSRLANSESVFDAAKLDVALKTSASSIQVRHRLPGDSYARTRRVLVVWCWL